MMRTTLLPLALTLLASASFAQQPAIPACDGDLTIVRVSQIKPGGTVQGLLAAAAAHQKWYRDHGVMDNEIVVSRIIVRDSAARALKYSDTEVLTYHIRPPGPGRVKAPDASWNAFVRQYRENSDIKAEYFTCVPKPNRKTSG
jgi:hypothetical protein